jgi:hypothetical protein
VAHALSTAPPLSPPLKNLCDIAACIDCLLMQVWDLGSERLMQQVSVRSSPGPSGGPVALERLSAGQSDPRLLLAGCSDGLLRLFDLRASLTPVASLATGEGEGRTAVLRCRTL